MIPTIVPAQSEHAAQLAKVMRSADLAECVAAGYRGADDALECSLVNSDVAWTVFFDDQVAAVLGVTSDEPGKPALVWCLTGDVVDRAPLTFLRTSKRMLAGILDRYPTLYNLVDARYQGAIDWLECLGFSFGDVIPHPDTGAPFRLAQLRRA